MPDLIMFRRHGRGCKRKGRATDNRCNCPIWVDARAQGGKLASLGTTDWATARGRVDGKVGSMSQGPGPGRTLGAAVDAFIADCDYRNRRPATLRSYRATFKAMTDALGRDLPLESWTLERLDAYRKARKVQPGSAARELTIIRLLVKFCMDREWLAKNPTRGMKAPKNDRGPTQPFSGDQVKAMLAASKAKPEINLFIRLSLYTGFRISDACSLRRACVNREDGTVTIKQIKTSRIVDGKLPADLVRDLFAFGSGEYFLWSGQGSLDTFTCNMRRKCIKLWKSIGIEDGHPHRLRDCFAIGLRDKDMPMEDRSLALGHRSISTTEKYYNAITATQRARIYSKIAELDFGD